MIQNRKQLAVTPAHKVVLDCLAAGIEASQPKNAVANTVSKEDSNLIVGDTTVDLTQFEEVVVLGGGKAAAQSAKALETILENTISGGVVVTNDPRETKQVDVIEGSHPVPNESGKTGAKAILSRAQKADEGTLILFPLSGGGSSLLPLPVSDVMLTDLQQVTEELLTSGATITEINTVRKHISQIKGGQFAMAAAPATVIGLVLSDVAGNNLGTIASGPIVGDNTTYQDAISVLESYDIEPPNTIKTHLRHGADEKFEETPQSNYHCFDNVSTHILADASTAIDAAIDEITHTPFTPFVLSTSIEGEACEIGKVHSAIGNEIIRSGRPIEPPAVLISGGEATVTVRAGGLGGPNQEFVLESLLQASSEEMVVASVDTDGEDGATDAAGALGTSTIVSNKDIARQSLDQNDTYPYFSRRDALVYTGQTGTNVNDLRIIAIPDPK